MVGRHCGLFDNIFKSHVQNGHQAAAWNLYIVISRYNIARIYTSLVDGHTCPCHVLVISILFLNLNRNLLLYVGHCGGLGQIGPCCGRVSQEVKRSYGGKLLSIYGNSNLIIAFLQIACCICLYPVVFDGRIAIHNRQIRHRNLTGSVCRIRILIDFCKSLSYLLI